MSLPPTFNMATTQWLDGKQSGDPAVCASTVAFAVCCNVESVKPRPSCRPTIYQSPLIWREARKPVIEYYEMFNGVQGAC